VCVVCVWCVCVGVSCVCGCACVRVCRACVAYVVKPNCRQMDQEGASTTTTCTDEPMNESCVSCAWCGVCVRVCVCICVCVCVVRVYHMLSQRRQMDQERANTTNKVHGGA